MLIVDTSPTEAGASVMSDSGAQRRVPPLSSPLAYRVLRLCPGFVTRRCRPAVQRMFVLPITDLPDLSAIHRAFYAAP